MQNAHLIGEIFAGLAPRKMSLIQIGEMKLQ